MPAERPIVFDCAGHRLVGIVHDGAATADRGLLIVVGGPQYRVGSHRLFVDLARGLAAAGVPVLRFDYRGMGDSDGDFRGFEHIADDIGAATSAFVAAVPALRRIALWGLCDAASAIMMSAPRLPQVQEIVLVNPWVRSPASAARTVLRHYYLMRLLDPAFWRKLAGGHVRPTTVVRDLGGNVRRALGRTDAATPDADRPAYPPGTLMPEPPADARPLPDRMASGFERFGGRVLLVTSGRDLTAREFLDTTAASRRWREVLARTSVERRSLPDCDHTFSSAACRDAIVAATVAWLGETAERER